MTEREKEALMHKDLIDITNILNSEQDFTLPNSLKSSNLLNLLPDKPDKPAIDFKKIFSVKRIVPIVVTAAAATVAIVVIPRLHLSDINFKPMSHPTAQKQVSDQNITEEDSQLVEEKVTAEPEAMEFADAIPESSKETTFQDVEESIIEENSSEEAQPVSDGGPMLGAGGDGDAPYKSANSRPPIVIDSEYWNNYRIQVEDIQQEDGRVIYDISLLDPVDGVSVYKLPTNDFDEILEIVASRQYLYILAYNNQNMLKLYNYNIDNNNKITLVKTTTFANGILENFKSGNYLYIWEEDLGDNATSSILIDDSAEEFSIKVNIINLENDYISAVDIKNCGFNYAQVENNSELQFEFLYKNKEGSYNKAYISYNNGEVKLARIEKDVS